MFFEIYVTRGHSIEQAPPPSSLPQSPPIHSMVSTHPAISAHGGYIIIWPTRRASSSSSLLAQEHSRVHAHTHNTRKQTVRATRSSAVRLRSDEHPKVRLHTPAAAFSCRTWPGARPASLSLRCDASVVCFAASPPMKTNISVYVPCVCVR